jgi:WD40 repeat protein/serine/threonine protein kinase
MNEQSIFIAALEREPAARPRFLDEACENNPGLRQRVERLIASHEAAVSFMDEPAGHLVQTIDQAPLETSGTQVGPYKLLQQIGEGGMGVVYMAEQLEPVKRRVALKIIKPGMDSRQVIARFEAERQALSLMDHPNIARVLDAGTTNSGRPYFVMELVKGQPITQYCDEHHLTPRQRLELLLPVCQAIQHAHQKGIIHRDIKPTNILVAEYDNQPVPKVIDFGVAKAISQSLTEMTMFTGLGQIVGTLEYMSPEQAKVNQLDIDTRSDIYSLGVLLYELLTGSTPFDKTRLRSAAWDEMLRIIREEEPEKPSTRLSSHHAPRDVPPGLVSRSETATLASIAAVRGTEPARLTKLVRGELDWIVMKALEKDRNRRYETANGFAADVHRYLCGEAVQAVPPSVGYRLRKFARRNRGPVVAGSAAAAMVVLAVVGLVVGTLLFQREQTRAANDRTELKAEANRQLETQLYRQRIALAEREWYANNLSRMEDLLTQCPPDQRGWEWRYLKGLRSSTRSPLSHLSAAHSVALSPDGKLLATGTQAGVVRIWQARTGTVLKEFKAHGAGAWTVAFSPDGRQLATGGFDGMIYLWDVETILQGKPDEDPKPSFPLEPTQRVWSVTFSPDGKYLASGSGFTGDQKGALTVWDLRSHQELFKLTHFTDTVTCVAFSPDGRQLATTCQGMVQLWDAQTGQEGMLFLRGPDTRRMGVAFSPDGRLLVSVGGFQSVHPDEEVQVWDVHTGQLIRGLPGHMGGLRCVAFSPDGRRIATAGLDQTIKIWDARTGDEVLTLRGHTDLVTCLAFSADSHQLASASVDRTVRIWDATPEPEQQSEYRTLIGHTGAVTDLAFHPTDECTLVSAGTDGTVRMWDARGGMKLGTLTLPPSNTRVKVAYSRDGRHLAAMSQSDQAPVAVWDVDSRKQVGEIRRQRAGGLSLSFSPDGRYVVASGQNRTVHVSDVMTGEEVPSRFKLNDWGVYCLVFSPDGRHLATGSSDSIVRIWDWNGSTEQPLTSLQHAGRVTGVAYSHDGKWLASASYDRTVKVWKTATWELLHDLPQSSGVQCVAFDRDGPRLAWGSNDGTVTVWDGPGTQPRVLRGHTSWIQAVAFSPNGKWIASASLDGTIKIWDAPPVPPAPDQEAREPVNSANPTPAEED